MGQGQVHPLTAIIQAILDFPCLKPDRSAAGSWEWLAIIVGFCRNFVDVVAPLTSLTSASKIFTRSPACQNALEYAKALLGTLILVALDFAFPFKLEVDASASGAVLLQVDEQGIDHPVCYFS